MIWSAAARGRFSYRAEASATYTRLESALRPLRRENQQIIPKKSTIATISRG
jgi:hypothetical protein